ncbi:hypothetical protein RAS1_18050 [Phycisphaerae bacterium RAS1]|nr:hypothetical protein RAS1_18050 [Phycisphaerae bacterium RAS1]
MPVFAWKKQPTRHFGEQWVPFAEIRLEDQRGRLREFSLQVDTGAVITLLRASAAKLLGLELTSGQKIDLRAVGGGVNDAYVHPVSVQLDGETPWPIRIAFSTGENVPHLLGRLDVFERVQLDFDASLEETRIAPPWLTAATRQTRQHLFAVADAIEKQRNAKSLGANVEAAASRFANRANELVLAAESFQKLARSDAFPLVIRALFELAVQFEYLMREPEARAKLYLEYSAVSRFRCQKSWLNLPGPIGDYLRNSPDRPRGEQRNRVLYDAVRSQFAIRRKPNRERNHWYEGDLRQLSREVGRESEHVAIYGIYSGWAHADAWTTGAMGGVAHGGLLHDGGTVSDSPVAGKSDGFLNAGLFEAERVSNRSSASNGRWTLRPPRQASAARNAKQHLKQARLK